MAERKRSRHHWPVEYATFCAKLVQARKDAGLTQAQAAKLLGRSQKYISESENGERRVDIVELSHFARVYGKPIGYFAG